MTEKIDQIYEIMREQIDILALYLDQTITRYNALERGFRAMQESPPNKEEIENALHELDEVAAEMGSHQRQTGNAIRPSMPDKID